ncbi:DUF2973 domain-containing protein [Chroococcidiopsis sp. FACHB-1243]|uniref:DUF2973 domain-containing protein n=1 Tax=Chroococcidiopsis sp. [FACHB-1243] TaxID=2692781 RepID=UPI001781F5BA|nr:DUF2973 domain-containing protein [Chroococcidiopsis sp. [FACHB-1243]]MBD2304592.1 DUF2973 domain-containing protein [Chroococcidiopsis sp. [FACHB-1243]]
MLHLLYILAFTILALIAVSNLIRNLIMFSFERDRTFASPRSPVQNRGNLSYISNRSVPHPELLDAAGNPIGEPLLVMRSIDVEDARAQLDALYEASPGCSSESKEEEA